VRKLAVAAFAALVFAAPAGAARIAPADKAQIDAALDTFVNHAVKRVDPAAAYDVVDGDLRAGLGRKAWVREGIPVPQYPAKGSTFHQWVTKFVSRNEVDLELTLFARPPSTRESITYEVDLQRRQGRWKLNSFSQAATFAAPGNKPKVTGVADLMPQSGGGSSGEPVLGRIYILIPIAAFGLPLLGLLGWGVMRSVQSRRALASYGQKNLPPVPRRRA
jgi:hypothetical protein